MNILFILLLLYLVWRLVKSVINEAEYKQQEKQRMERDAFARLEEKSGDDTNVDDGYGIWDDEYKSTLKPVADPHISTDVEIKKRLISNYGKLNVEELLFNKEIDEDGKVHLLKEVHRYDREEAYELVETATKEEKRAKLKGVKRKIFLKAEELYNNVPVDDKRVKLTDEAKAFVWNRDKGRCVKCGDQKNLEFDHVIPFSKGGSSTGRNIQLLCEKCNREKSDKI